ncbi:MAG TPA: FAD-binding oxidoreductase [Thermoanaerobaculaceae bacterium]|nr:FAD-binding oxidoreductase [Thermoanaerobaculaceae bacterium]
MQADRDGLAGKLAQIVGDDHVRSGDAAGTFAVDGMVPRLVVSPGSQSEVEAVAAACSAAGAAMAPRGGGTALGLGNPPSRLDVLVALDRLARIVEFDAANLNVTAEAGVRLAELQRVLAEQREFLPLDPAQAERMTVGGLVETNASGPSRLLYGSARDWVLGLRAVLPSGERIRCGGKVIKNVSGYDMNKLFIGSLGSLGIVTEATFKLLPLPAARATVVGVFAELKPLAAAVTRTLESFLLPEALEALDRQALAAVGGALGLAGRAGFGLAVSLAGSRATVERQVRDFTALLGEGKADATVAVAEAGCAAAWRAIREVHAGTAEPRVVAKVAVPIGRTLDLFASAEASLRRLSLAGALTAHAGSGIVRLSAAAGAGTALEPVAAALRALRSEAEAADGSLVLEAAPVALKRVLDAWGEPREGFSVMRRLKAEFDPHGVMNPGRFVGGL